MSDLLTQVEGFLLSLRVEEFKAMKKAIGVLVRTGMDRATATNIIVEAHRGKFDHNARVDERFNRS